MIFPFGEEEEMLEETQYIPREYEMNFETGQITGKVAEGIDALLVWVWMALQTPRYRYYIYSWEYGQEYEEIIGKSYSKGFTDMELERMTEECLTVNPYITGIENFTCEKNEDRINLSFTLVTTLGSREVDLDVRGNDF